MKVEFDGNTAIIGFIRELKKLDYKDQVKTIQKAERFALAPIKRDAIKNVKDNTGNLKKSIGYFKRSIVFRFITKDPWYIPTIIGARTYKPYKGHHAHLVNYGTDLKEANKKKVLKFEINGKIIFSAMNERTKPTYFLTNAINKNQSNVESRFKQKLKKLFDK